MSHKRASRLLWSALIAIVAVATIAWVTPSHDYLYVPNTATPVASKVTVEGEKPSPRPTGALF